MVPTWVPQVGTDSALLGSYLALATGSLGSQSLFPRSALVPKPSDLTLQLHFPALQLVLPKLKSVTKLELTARKYCFGGQQLGLHTKRGTGTVQYLLETET